MMSNLPFSMKDRVHVHVHAAVPLLVAFWTERDCGKPLLFFCWITFLF